MTSENLPPLAVSYADLIERLQKLAGPDQDVDAEIAVRVLGFIKTNRMEKWPGEQPIWEFTDPARNTTGSWSAMVREYTASLDAAVALVERLGFQWLRKSPVAMTVYRPLTREQDERKEWAVHHGAAGATPAIALLIATLKALDQQHD